MLPEFEFLHGPQRGILKIRQVFDKSKLRIFLFLYLVCIWNYHALLGFTLLHAQNDI